MTGSGTHQVFPRVTPRSTPHVSRQGDISGGLLINGTWHIFTLCSGGWCHLSTHNLVHYQSHGVTTTASSPRKTGKLRVPPKKEGGRALSTPILHIQVCALLSDFT